MTSTDFAGLVADLAHKPLAYGANCGVGASDLLRTILGLAIADNGVPIVARAMPASRNTSSAKSSTTALRR